METSPISKGTLEEIDETEGAWSIRRLLTVNRNSAAGLEITHLFLHPIAHGISLKWPVHPWYYNILNEPAGAWISMWPSDTMPTRSEGGHEFNLWKILRNRVPPGLALCKKPRTNLGTVRYHTVSFCAWTMAAEKALGRDRECMTSVQFWGAPIVPYVVWCIFDVYVTAFAICEVARVKIKICGTKAMDEYYCSYVCRGFLYNTESRVSSSPVNKTLLSHIRRGEISHKNKKITLKWKRGNFPHRRKWEISPLPLQSTYAI